MTRPFTRFLAAVSTTLLLAGAAQAQTSQPAPRPGTVEERLARIERLLDSGALMDMLNQQEQLRRSLQELRGEIEVLRRDLGEVTERQREMLADVDRRLRPLETAPPPAAQSPALAADPAAPGADQAPASQAPADPASASQAPAGSGDEFSDYQAAFAHLKAGRYTQAAESFEAFMRRYPRGQFAPNALYWLGESHYVQRDFDRAMAEFQRVLDEYPDNAKRPDAMLKIGFIHYERNDMARARATLERVKATYPNSAAAALAEQRLLRMGAARR